MLLVQCGMFISTVPSADTCCYASVNVKTKHINKLQVFVVGKNLANNFQKRDLMACYKDSKASRWIYRGLQWI